jgi:hypothetical protein
MIDIKDENNLLKRNRENALKQRYRSGTTKGQAEHFFLKIYGLNDLKELIFLGLTAEEQINICLIGSPASPKDIFIAIIKEKCNDVFYFDASINSGKNLIDKLYENKTSRVIVIEKIDKLQKNYQNSLRGFLDNGEIIVTLKSKRMNFKIENAKVFATANDVKKIDPVESRMLCYKIPEYSDKDFIEFAKCYFLNDLLTETSEMVAKELLTYNIKDTKAVVSLGSSLSIESTKDEIDTLIGNFVKKYRENTNIHTV